MKRKFLDRNDSYLQGESESPSLEELEEPSKKVRRRSSTLYPLCLVCGDRSSGLHYGVITCNGCRSFFRRAIGGRKDYECEYGADCVVDVKARAQCKACRLMKSLKVGMRPEEVLMVCGSKPTKCTKGSEESENDEDSSSSSSDMLLPLQKQSFDVHHILWNIKNYESQLDQDFAHLFPKQNLTSPVSKVQDIFDRTQIQLYYLVGWAKVFQVFNDLEPKSKVALLKAHCMELIHLEVAKRSVDPNEEWNAKVSCPFREIMDPFKTLRVSEEELLCLKALVLFNPYTSGLSEKDSVKVGVFQQQVRLMLETITEESSSSMESRGRIFNLLLILPSVSNIAEQLRATLRSHRANGFTKTYRLLDELVLTEINGIEEV